MWIQTPMLVVHLKIFGCKSLKLTESFWLSPCASLFYLCDHRSLFFGFCVSFLLSLGVALHYIHAFYSSFFFLLKKKKKRKEKGSTLCSCTILFVFENKVGQFIFTWHVYCTLFSFDELIYCTWLVETLQCMLCEKDVYGVYHFVLILISHFVWLSDLILLRKA